MDSEFASLNSDFIETYLKHLNSIPTFIQAVFLRNNGYKLEMRRINDDGSATADVEMNDSASVL
jgi:hypothetical protein